MDAGTIIGERYVLDRQIGEGGMAAVWLAEDKTLRRMVAIKFLWAKDERGKKQLAKSFLREARLAASVHHPNVVQVLDFGLHEDERPYMVMEALDGESLGDQFNAGQLYTLEQVAHIGTAALEGLIAVHAAGIVHRDLKPENIFLVAHHNRVQPKLLDFGISRVVDQATGLRSAVTTIDGHVVGTPEYMSPEQARGLKDVDHRADIYAMGVILYEMVVGDVPYKDDAFGDLLMKVVKGGARTVQEIAPSVPVPFSEVIATAMSRDRELRYQDVAAMLDALTEAARPHLTGAPITLELPTRIARRRTVPVEADAEEEELDLPDRTGRVLLDTTSSAPDAPDVQGRAAASAASGADSRAGLGPRDTPRASSSSLPGTDPAGRPRGSLVVGLAIAVLLGLGVLALRPAAEPEQPRYIVVQAAGGAEPPGSGDDNAAPDPDDSPAAPDTVPVPAQPAAPEPSADGPAEPEPKRPAPAPRAGAKKAQPLSRTQRLAAAFKRQKAPVVRCFRSHPEAALDEVSVRVSVDSGGRVSRAELLPASAATTPAGRCIGAAVAAMRFGRQPDAVAFRVPLRVKRD